jgi:hypothetical protein
MAGAAWSYELMLAVERIIDEQTTKDAKHKDSNKAQQDNGSHPGCNDEGKVQHR